MGLRRPERVNWAQKTPEEANWARIVGGGGCPEGHARLGLKKKSFLPGGPRRPNGAAEDARRGKLGHRGLPKRRIGPE